MIPTVVPLSLGVVRAFLVKGDGCILIDAGPRGSGRRLLAAVGGAGVDPASIRLLLITHGHEDHFGGCAELRGALTCPVAVHASDADILRAGRNGPANYVGAAARLIGRLGALHRSPATPCTPAIVISDSLDLTSYGVEGRVEHTPGHTPGSVTVFLAGGEAIVGDLLRGGMVAAHAPRWPFVVDDMTELRRSIAQVLGEPPRLLWTSHGGPLSPDRVRAFLREAK
jgi:hydroxyacylglutathione hydrolase